MPASRATEPEWSLLLAACSTGNDPQKAEHIHSLLQTAIRWEVVLSVAESHGVLPMLNRALSRFRDVVPSEVFETLGQRYQSNIHKALMLSRELFRVVDRLSADRIEVMAYKGLALAEAVYGDIALRQTGDIDLFIHAADFRRVREAVRDLGYWPHTAVSEAHEKEHLMSGYECAFDGPAGPNLLEVQWAIQPRFYAVDLDMEKLFHRAEMTFVAGRAIKTPALEDLFLVLCVHAAKHVWGRLIWLCDLLRIMELPNLNWERMAARSERLGIMRIVRVSILLANRLLKASIPTAGRASFGSDPVTEMLVEEIVPHIFREQPFDTESWAYFRLMLRLRERVMDRARFLSRLAFTAGPGEWEAVHLPEALSPLYRMVRIARLARRTIGR